MNALRICGAAVLALGIAASAAQAPSPAKDRVSFKSHGLALTGFLFKPDGAGPFPAVVWNHGSEPNPGGGPQFDTVAGIFVPRGYVVFAPIRRGHKMSEGPYILDERDQARRRGGHAEAERTVVHLLEAEQLDDQLAGLEYVKHLSYVDSTRVAVAGCSFGGIQALLGAERSAAGYRAAFAISPAAQSWTDNPLLRDRLIRAVRNISIPVMLIQPAKDDSLEPSRVLGAELTKLKKPYFGKVYPATGPEEEQKHCFGGARGMHVWADDAVSFLEKFVHP
ncbi:MAG TPA: prolyl oligopeptidase family serine peptidase [Vicinamibacterales bacterium]|nr:prolyl oligopeptidase family serine peptidase [Vicinamibacterales bacterium]